jgi:hypothetical protein
MAVTKRVSQVTFGGNASNNPINYSWTDYSNYPDLNLSLQYQRMNVIAVHDILQVPLQVTGLVQVDGSGQPMLGANDLVYMPCPPFC